MLFLVALSGAAAQAAGAGEVVHVTGFYKADNASQELVRGTLETSRGDLRVEGVVFDWVPQDGELMELWGRLEPQDEGAILKFYNGRNLGEDRFARPTPALSAGDTAELYLKISEGGSLPLTVTQGITEDQQVFTLPGYEGPMGVQCVSGTVSIDASGRKTLSGASACG